MAGTGSSLFLAPSLSPSVAAKAAPLFSRRRLLSPSPSSSLPSRPKSLSLSPRATWQAAELEKGDAAAEAAGPSAPAPPSLPFRVGHGFDLHRLEPGLPLIIGGVNIPHDRGCEAHSDGILQSPFSPLPRIRGLPQCRRSLTICSESCDAGDVLLHCVVDAILGALGLPDIGQIFPDSDPKWRGAASSVFIKEAVSLCALCSERCFIVR